MKSEPGSGPSQVSETEEAPAGRQNVLLREHFRKEYLNIRGEESGVPDAFVEEFVDMRIDAFLKRVKEDMDGMHESCRRLSKVRPEKSVHRTVSVDDRIQLAALLKDLEERSERLRKTLARVFLELDATSDFQLSPEPGEAGFQLEQGIDAILSNTSKALREVELLLFSPAAVVHLEDLQNRNMLMRLHEVQIVARTIRRSL